MLLFNDEGMISTIVQFDMQVRGDAVGPKNLSTHSCQQLIRSWVGLCAACMHLSCRRACS